MSEEIIKGLNVSRETIGALTEYVLLLEKWNRTINLVAKSTIDDAWERHIKDSAQVFGGLPETLENIMDLGSGGGLPGLILAILCKEKAPSTSVTLVESDVRKCAFLSTAAATLGLNVKVENKRIEQMAPANIGVVTARALAPLELLMGFAFRHLEKDGQAIFLKGRDHLKEIEEARKMWCFDVDITPSLTSAEAAILRLQNIEPKQR